MKIERLVCPSCGRMTCTQKQTDLASALFGPDYIPCSSCAQAFFRSKIPGFQTRTIEIPDHMLPYKEEIQDYCKYLVS